MSDANTARLRVLTFDAEPPDNLVMFDATIPCDGSMVCTCAGCELDRLRRRRDGVRASRQPWHPRQQRAA